MPVLSLICPAAPCICVFPKFSHPSLTVTPSALNQIPGLCLLTLCLRWYSLNLPVEHSLFSFSTSHPQLPDFPSCCPGSESWLIFSISTCSLHASRHQELLFVPFRMPLASSLPSHRLSSDLPGLSVTGLPIGLSFCSLSPTQYSPQTFTTFVFLKLSFYCAHLCITFSDSLLSMRWDVNP